MAYVELMDTQNKPKGLLYEVLDSAVVIFLGKDPLTVSGPGGQYRYQTIQASQIYRIKLKRKGKVGRSAKKGVMYGTLAGLALGGLEAAAYESDPWTEVNTGALLAVGALSGAMSGAMYGAIIGSFKTKIPINGSQTAFNHQKDLLKGHAYHILSDIHDLPL